MVNEYLEQHRKPDDKGESNFIIEWKERLSVSIKTMVLQVHCGLFLLILVTLNLNCDKT